MATSNFGLVNVIPTIVFHCMNADLTIIPNEDEVF